MRKMSPLTGIRSLDRPSRSESLYRLSYHGRQTVYGFVSSFTDKRQPYVRAVSYTECGGGVQQSGKAARGRFPVMNNFRKYSHAPYNDVSVNDGPHIRRWSHNIIIQYYIILHYHSVTVAYSIQYSNMLYRFVA